MADIKPVGGYNGNENLPKAGTTYSLTTEQLLEYERCMESPSYFAEHYFKIVTLDDGLQTMKLYDFQKEAADDYLNTNKMILATSRQVGKTTIATVIILHYVLFNEDKTVFILGNKETSRYRNLTKWKPIYLRALEAQQQARGASFFLPGVPDKDPNTGGCRFNVLAVYRDIKVSIGYVLVNGEEATVELKDNWKGFFLESHILWLYKNSAAFFPG
jgi:hypothetical protein